MESGEGGDCFLTFLSVELSLIGVRTGDDDNRCRKKISSERTELGDGVDSNPM